MPAFRRKEFERGFASLNQGELAEWCEAELAPDISTAQRHEYERLLQRFPSRFREYCERERKAWASLGDLFLPQDPTGKLDAQLELGKLFDEQLEEGSLVCELLRACKTEGDVRNRFPQFFKNVIDALPQAKRQRFLEVAKFGMKQLDLAEYIGEVKGLSGSYVLLLRKHYRKHYRKQRK